MLDVFSINITIKMYKKGKLFFIQHDIKGERTTDYETIFTHSQEVALYWDVSPFLLPIMAPAFCRSSIRPKEKYRRDGSGSWNVKSNMSESQCVQNVWENRLISIATIDYRWNKLTFMQWPVLTSIRCFHACSDHVYRPTAFSRATSRLPWIQTSAAVRFTLRALKYHFILVVYQIVNKDKRCL